MTGFGNAHRMFEQPGTEVRVVSYNLLSQDLLDDHPHLYSHSSDKWLRWSYRGPNLIEEMRNIQADVSVIMRGDPSFCQQLKLPQSCTRPSR